MPARRKISAAFTEAACLRLIDGESVAEIAAELSVDRTALYRQLKAINCAGLKIREQSVSEDIRFYVKHHFKQGMTPDDLAAKYGLRKHTIHSILEQTDDAAERGADRRT
jgi:DNA-binding transcriptional regulator LsrR (DeoR family)